jgi:alanine racemase
VLEIDLGAIAANWRRLRDRVKPGTETAAVVKADAYGLGMAPVASALHAAGCRLFFVANLSEGLALRRALPDARIAILNGFASGSGREFETARLIPVLNDLEQIEAWRAAKFESRPAAMLHVDTGMSRLGLPPREVDQLAASPSLLSGVTLAGILSHLACADDRKSPRNPLQLRDFRAALKRLPKAAAGLAASSGMFLGRPYHFDLVRPGAALYGVNPLPERRNPMAQAVYLKAKILQVREIDRGGTVGYGAVHRMARNGRVATVGVGYADGWFRSASPRASAGIAGRRVPIIGRISMDLLTIDVTGIDPAHARVGLYVDLLDDSYGINEFARDAGTIGYEVLTALGPRHHRIYRGADPG